jgi:hypothetical protein
MIFRNLILVLGHHHLSKLIKQKPAIPSECAVELSVVVGLHYVSNGEGIPALPPQYNKHACEFTICRDVQTFCISTILVDDQGRKKLKFPFLLGRVLTVGINLG